MILTDENDIYMYFDVIRQKNPKRILDIGMFLKRIGSVSRKVMNCEVPPETVLDGVDFFPETDFPVWRNVYDTIFPVDSFPPKEKAASYDLTCLLGRKEMEEQALFPKVAEQIPHITRYLLADWLPRALDRQKPFYQVDLNVEGKAYYLLDFGER